MSLFWALYASLSAGFLAGVAAYLWRWKRPPEVIVKTVYATPKIVRCKQCLYFKIKWVHGDHCETARPVPWCALHDRQIALDAFCSSGEKEMKK